MTVFLFIGLFARDVPLCFRWKRTKLRTDKMSEFCQVGGFWIEMTSLSEVKSYCRSFLFFSFAEERIVIIEKRHPSKIRMVRHLGIHLWVFVLKSALLDQGSKSPPKS